MTCSFCLASSLHHHITLVDLSHTIHRLICLVTLTKCHLFKKTCLLELQPTIHVLNVCLDNNKEQGSLAMSVPHFVRGLARLCGGWVPLCCVCVCIYRCAHRAPAVLNQKLIFRRETDGRNLCVVLTVREFTLLIRELSCLPTESLLAGCQPFEGKMVNPLRKELRDICFVLLKKLQSRFLCVS